MLLIASPKVGFYDMSSARQSYKSGRRMSPTLCASTLVQYSSQSRMRNKVDTKTAILAVQYLPERQLLRKHAVMQRDRREKLVDDVGAVIKVPRRHIVKLSFSRCGSYHQYCLSKSLDIFIGGVIPSTGLRQVLRFLTWPLMDEALEFLVTKGVEGRSFRWFGR